MHKTASFLRSKLAGRSQRALFLCPERLLVLVWTNRGMSSKTSFLKRFPDTSGLCVGDRLLSRDGQIIVEDPYFFTSLVLRQELGQQYGGQGCTLDLGGLE